MATDAVADDQLSAAIQDIIDASLAPGAIDWNCCGVDLPPTGVIVGVRVPGRPDILLAAGSNLDDGTALDPTASFSTANLGYSIVAEIGMKLVADGTLDPDATIDAWLPDAPNAERITVGMLIDATHGWGDYGDVLGQNVTADLERRWTSGEAVATLMDVAPDAEPGTFVGDGVGTGMLALGYIAEQVTGRSLADLVTSTITQPAGLDAQLLQRRHRPSRQLPTRSLLRRRGSDAQHRRGRHSPPTSPTHQPRTRSCRPSPTCWTSSTPGSTAPGGRARRHRHQRRSPPTASWTAEYVGDPPRYLGLDVPYTGYCPCQPTSDGNTVDAIGRRPATFGTDVHMFHYPDDDISIVLHYNSNTWADRSQIETVLADIRATVAASN